MLEKAFGGLYRDLCAPLGVDGDQAIPVPLLRNRVKGKVVWGKVVGEKGDTVFKQIHRAARRWSKADVFGEKEADGLGVFGGELYEDAVAQVDFRKAFEAVGQPKVYAVERKRAGLRR